MKRAPSPSAFFSRLVRSTTPRRKPVQHEKGEQASGVKLLRSLGAAVYVLGTRRARGSRCRCGAFVPGDQGTRQTPGVADVLAFLPAPRGTRLAGCQLWWEAKRAAGGRASDAQRVFAANCAAAGVAHCLGDVNDLVAWLIEHGYLRANQVAHYRTQQGGHDRHA